METKMDWLKFEQRIRDVLNAVKVARDVGKLTTADIDSALYAVSDVVGEETGRGFVFDVADQIETPEALITRLTARAGGR